MRLSNPFEQDCVQITFPLPDDELMEKLNTIGVVDSIDSNCYVDLCSREIPLLSILENQPVNADEINYLARRLDSFGKYELAKFQSAVYVLDATNVGEMINLTFNLHNYTLIQSFHDMTAIGFQNFMDKNIGITEDEKTRYDFHALGLELIMSTHGDITPFGVLYENEMGMDLVYDGKLFPAYVYKSDYIISIYITRKDDASEDPKAAWLYLPEPDCCVDKALMRLGVNSLDECSLYIEDINRIPSPLHEIINRDFDYNSLNRLSRVVSQFSDYEITKLRAVADYANAFTAYEIAQLAENLDWFHYVPNARTYEACGKYLIMEAGGFKPEENPEYFDFKRYIDEIICEKNGRFCKGGFAYSMADIDEIMHPKEQENGISMNGM